MNKKLLTALAKRIEKERIQAALASVPFDSSLPPLGEEELSNLHSVLHSLARDMQVDAEAAKKIGLNITYDDVINLHLEVQSQADSKGFEHSHVDELDDECENIKNECIENGEDALGFFFEEKFSEGGVVPDQIESIPAILHPAESLVTKSAHTKLMSEAELGELKVTVMEAVEQGENPKNYWAISSEGKVRDFGAGSLSPLCGIQPWTLQWLLVIRGSSSPHKTKTKLWSKLFVPLRKLVRMSLLVGAGVTQPTASCFIDPSLSS